MSDSTYTNYTTDRTLGANKTYNAVFTTDGDNSTMDKEDFLKLLVAQMQNQDFNDPMDNSTMVTEMAQFSNMEQMQQMSSYMQSNYAMSLVGKTATASYYSVSGETVTTTGTIDRVMKNGDDYVVYIDGKSCNLSDLTSVQLADTAKKDETPVVDATEKAATADPAAEKT